jgi:broad specificity phosphatase PhoE
MKPKRIILLRHGESEGNLDKSVYSQKPDHKLDLTPLGHQQAFEAGKSLKALLGEERVFIFSSPHYRTRQTLAGVLKSGLHVERSFEEPRLREQEWGHLRDQKETEKIEAERDKFGSFYYRFPDGESGADVYDRITTFLDTLFRDFEKMYYHDNVLIVTHGMTIRLFLMRWFHESVETFEHWSNPKNCQYFIMERASGSIRGAHEDGRYKLITPLETW